MTKVTEIFDLQRSVNRELTNKISVMSSYESWQVKRYGNVLPVYNSLFGNTSNQVEEKSWIERQAELQPENLISEYQQL